jgi:hypothetical protein
VLQVLNASSGGVVWSNDCDAPNAFVVGSTIVTASCGGVSLATGATRWTKPGATFFRGDPTGVSAPAIYGRNAGGALIAVRPDGTLKWRGGTSYSDVLAAGPVRLWTQCDGSDVCALNRTTGARAFKSDGAFGAGPTALASDFAIVDSSIVRADNGHFVTEFGSVERGYSGDDFAVANGHIIATAGRNVDVFVLAG